MDWSTQQANGVKIVIRTSQTNSQDFVWGLIELDSFSNTGTCVGCFTDIIEVTFNLEPEEFGHEDLQDNDMDLDEENDKMKHDTRYD